MIFNQRSLSKMIRSNKYVKQCHRKPRKFLFRFKYNFEVEKLRENKFKWKTEYFIHKRFGKQSTRLFCIRK